MEQEYFAKIFVHIIVTSFIHAYCWYLWENFFRGKTLLILETSSILHEKGLQNVFAGYKVAW